MQDGTTYVNCPLLEKKKKISRTSGGNTEPLWGTSCSHSLRNSNPCLLSFLLGLHLSNKAIISLTLPWRWLLSMLGFLSGTE